MDAQAPGLRWGVEQRLEFIEFRLFWEGAINRSDITSYFGVSIPQASKDLSQYQEMAPDNLRYDKREKRYFASESFVPVLLDPSADRYLAQLKSIADHVALPGETWLSRLPSFDSLPIPQRRVDVQMLRRLVSAVRNNRSVEIEYQSMNPKRPEPLWRRITPHAFGSDGFRWHLRAFCHIEGEFKDFLLSRSLGVRNEDEPGADHSDDRLWHERIDVLLTPNPQLSKSQRKIIAQDYKMEDEHVNISIRKALLYYFEKRLRLDVAELLDNPNETPVVVANREVFEKALAEATGRRAGGNGHTINGGNA